MENKQRIRKSNRCKKKKKKKNLTKYLKNTDTAGQMKQKWKGTRKYTINNHNNISHINSNSNNNNNNSTNNNKKPKSATNESRTLRVLNNFK